LDEDPRPFPFSLEYTFFVLENDLHFTSDKHVFMAQRCPLRTACMTTDVTSETTLFEKSRLVIFVLLTTFLFTKPAEPCTFRDYLKVVLQR